MAVKKVNPNLDSVEAEYQGEASDPDVMLLHKRGGDRETYEWLGTIDHNPTKLVAFISPQGIQLGAVGLNVAEYTAYS